MPEHVIHWAPDHFAMPDFTRLSTPCGWVAGGVFGDTWTTSKEIATCPTCLSWTQLPADLSMEAVEAWLAVG